MKNIDTMNTLAGPAYNRCIEHLLRIYTVCGHDAKLHSRCNRIHVSSYTCKANFAEWHSLIVIKTNAQMGKTN